MKFLVIDDELDDRKLTIKYLKEEFPFAQFIEIYSPKRFYEILEEDYDVVITDYQLHWTNGIKVLTEIRKRKPFTPVIMLTAVGTEEIAVEAIKHGLDDYVVKSPEHFMRLPAAVKTAIENEKAREKEKLLSLIVENAKESIVTVDGNGKIIYVNKATEEIFGWKAEELIGKHMSIFAVDADEQKKQFENAIREGWAKFETVRRDKNGDEIPVLITVIPFKDEAGNLLFSTAIMMDLRELKKYKGAWIRSEARYKKLFEQSPIAITVVDRDGTIIMANKNFAKLTGYSLNEIIGEHFTKFVAEEDRERMMKYHEQRITGKGRPPTTYEYKCLRKDGEIRYIEIKIIQLPDNKTLSCKIDITERKRMEEALKESEEKYRTIFEATGTATVIIEEDTTISLANAEFEKLSGYSRKEIEGKKSWTEFVVKEDLEKMLEYHRLRRIDPKAVPKNYEFRFIDKHGNIKNILLTVDIIPGTERSVASLLDITELKRVEKALKESEKRFRSLIENAHDAIYIITPKGFEYVNPAFEKLTGYSTGEIFSEGFNFWKLIHPDDMELIKKREEARIKGEELPSRYEFRVITKDGKVRMVEASTVDISEKSKIRIMGMLRDVTERRRAEEEIKKLSDLHYVIGMSINRSETIEQLCKNLLEGIKKIVDIEYANIFLCDKRKKALKPIAHVGYPKELAKEIIKEYAMEEKIWEAVRTCLEKKDRHIKNVQKYKPLSFNWNLYKKYDIKELYSIPLISKRKVEGVMQVASTPKNPLTEDKKRLLKNIAEQIAVGMAKIMAEEDLKKSEEKYRTLVTRAVEGIYRTTIDGKVLEINPAVAKMFGYTPEEFLKLENIEITYKEPRKRREFIKKLMEDGEVRNYEIEYVRKDGRILIARESARLIEGRIVEGIIHDITKERLYRRKLEILAEVSTSLLGEIEMDALYNTTLRAILKAMDADGGVIFEMKENELHLRKAIKMSREYRKKYKTVKMGEYLVGKVAKTKEPILVFDSLQDKRATVAVIKSDGYRSAIVVPILLEDQVLGSIGVISRKPHHFTEADIDTLQTMANSLASAMRVASMHQQVVKALQEEKEFKMKTAHYFFNPIAIAKGYLELAMEEKDGKDKILKAIEAINRVEKVVKNVTQRGEIRE